LEIIMVRASHSKHKISRKPYAPRRRRPAIDSDLTLISNDQDHGNPATDEKPERAKRRRKTGARSDRRPARGSSQSAQA
jgi:hypothetical protein